MKKYLKLTMYALACLILAAPLSVHAKCKAPERGPPGATGATGPSFISTFGTWYTPSNIPIPVGGGGLIPFTTQEISSGILDVGNTSFIFTQSGIYQITFGYFGTTPSNQTLQMELNLAPVPGGTIQTFFGNQKTITVMLSAAAGDTLDVRNLGAPIVLDGGSSINSASVFISILQIANPI